MPITTQEQVGVRQPSVCGGIILVFINRGLKVLKSFFETLSGALIPKITASKIILMGFGLNRSDSHQSLPLSRRQICSHFCYNVSRHAVFEAKQVAYRAVVTFRPEVLIRRGSYEL